MTVGNTRLAKDISADRFWLQSRKQTEKNKIEEKTSKQAHFSSVLGNDLRQRANLFGEIPKEEQEKLPKPEDKNQQKEKDKTDTTIVVKPDGTRVLVITVCSGGGKRTICLKLSDPEKFSGGTNQKGTNEEEENTQIEKRNEKIQAKGIQ